MRITGSDTIHVAVIAAEYQASLSNGGCGIDSPHTVQLIQVGFIGLDDGVDVVTELDIILKIIKMVQFITVCFKHRLDHTRLEVDSEYFPEKSSQIRCGIIKDASAEYIGVQINFPVLFITVTTKGKKCPRVRSSESITLFEDRIRNFITSEGRWAWECLSHEG